MLAASHLGSYDDRDCWDPGCSSRLRRRWEELLAELDAGVLRLRVDPGGPRWYLQGEALHAGTLVEILSPAGTWHPGRFEYRHHPRHPKRLEPRFHAVLGGWDLPGIAFTIPADAALRIPPR